MNLSLYYGAIAFGVIAWVLLEDVVKLTTVTRPLAYAAVLLGVGLAGTFGGERPILAALVPTLFGVVILINRAWRRFRK